MNDNDYLVKTHICLTCGRLLKDGWHFCPNCRLELTGESSCPECQVALHVNWAYCPNCRRSLKANPANDYDLYEISNDWLIEVLRK